MSLAFLSPDRVEAWDGGYPAARSPLEPLLRLRGGRFAIKAGWRVVTDFGTPAEEAAACAQAVGIVDRSHLGKLELQAPAAALRELIADVSGGGTGARPGLAIPAGSAWWCPMSAERMLVLAAATTTAELRESLSQRLDGGVVVDVSSAFVALGLVGPRARDLLARVTAIDVRPHATPECGLRPGSLARVPGVLLRETGDRFLLLCGTSHAEYMWEVLVDAAASLGGAIVGTAALPELDLIGEAVAEHA